MNTVKRSFVAILSAVAAAVCLIGCNAEPDPNKNTEVPPVRDDLFAPSAYSLGDEVYWNACSGATSYEVYDGNEKLGVTTATSYDVGKSDNDRKIRVKAVYASGVSDFSKSTTVSKNTNYSANEIVTFADNSLGVRRIPSDVRMIVIERETQTTVSACFVIEKRSNDLVFSLKNVALVNEDGQYDYYATISTAPLSYERKAHDWSVVFSVEGECSVDGGKITEKPYVPDVNTEHDGNRGRNGIHALYVSSVVVRGGGSLALKGGDAQNGARGASATLGSTATYGHGGNGGRGGAPVFCKYLLLDMSYDDCELSLEWGISGKKGGRGDDPKALTGNIKHFGCTDADCDGVDGTREEGMIQNKIVKSGRLIDLSDK